VSEERTETPAPDAEAGEGKAPDTLRTGVDAPVDPDAPPGGIDTPAPPDPLLGTVIDDRYRVESVIGEGGMGIVYLASHVILNKRLALKVLRRDLANDGEVVQRFIQEAQSASAIGHENIVDISDFGRLDNGAVYFVMELLEGESLGQIIEQGAMTPDAETLDLVRQLANALDAAHERGIVHRDLKPDNVFVVPRGSGGKTVKVLDFGIAKVAGSTGKLTRTGMVFGTPHYMSPEQAAGQSVDQRTDVYALGVILYEMFTGRVPFDADTFMGILSKHMFEAPARPSAALDDAIGHLGPIEDVILRAMAKKPEDRYPSMKELVADLLAIAGGGQAAVAAPRDPSTGFTMPTATGAALSSSPGVDDTLGSIPGLGGSGGSLPGWALPVGVIAAFLLLVGGGAAAAVFAFGGPGNDGQDDASGIVAPDGDEGAGDDGAAAHAEADRDTETQGNGDGQDQQVASGELPRMVSLESEPPGAEVIVAGAVVGNTPTRLPRPIDGQGREVEVRLPGYERKTVRLTSRSPELVTVRLEEVRRARPTGRADRREPAKATTSTTKTPEKPPPNDRDTLGPTIRSEVRDPWAE